MPNDVYHDRGELIISYEKIHSLILHHYVLSKVHRQTEGNLNILITGIMSGMGGGEEDKIKHNLKNLHSL